MFTNNRLPTLDTEIWMKNGQVLHSFFEKPTVGNKVLSRDTALPLSSIRATLLQETVRRLVNCNTMLDLKEKQVILSRFAQKLINSGHSVESSKILIVQGAVKYFHKLEASRKNPEDPNYKPLYLSKSYNEKNREVNNVMVQK